MLTIDEMREKLMDRKISSVAARIGVHENTLYKLVNGSCEPTQRTLKKLNDYLESK